MVCYIHGTPLGTPHLQCVWSVDERSTPHMDAAEDGQFAWIERASSIYGKPGTGLCTHTAANKHTHTFKTLIVVVTLCNTKKTMLTLSIG